MYIHLIYRLKQLMCRLFSSYNGKTVGPWNGWKVRGNVAYLVKYCSNDWATEQLTNKEVCFLVVSYRYVLSFLITYIMLIEASDPSIRDVMGLLQHLNMQELKDLLHDERRLETMIRDSQKVNNVKLVFVTYLWIFFKVKQQESEKDILLASNKSLAEYNLSWEPKVNSGRQKLIELYQTAAQVDKILEEKEKLLENQGGNINLDTAVVLLQSSATQAEQESEVIAEKFLDGTLDVDTFTEEFQLKRKIAHLRKVKADKMKELVSKQKQKANAVRPAPPPPIHFQTAVSPVSNIQCPYPVGAPGNLPYPIYPPNQPQGAGLPYPVFPPTNMYPHF